MKPSGIGELSILLAEDDPVVAKTLVASLESLGHRVAAVATDGVQAVRFAAELKPDLAIIDIDLPVMNGIAATKKILSNSSLPIIISTGRCDKEALESARQLNIQAYLNKPFSILQLESAIGIALMQHRRHDESQHKITDLNQALDHAPSVPDAEALTSEQLIRIGLTQRQAEVLHWIAQGKSNGEIGIILNSSPRTVAKHVEIIFLKLRVESRISAVAEARLLLEKL